MLRSFYPAFLGNKPKIRKPVIFLGYFTISILTLLPILISDKHIGHSIDWTIPDDPLLMKRYFEVNNFVWWDNFLGVDRSWYIYNFFYNYLALLPAQFFGISGSILAKIYVVVTSILSGYLFYLFSKNLLYRHFSMVNPDLVPFLTGLFYSMSAFKVNFMISGELFGFHFGLLLIPLFLNVFLKYLIAPSKRKMILVTIFFTALAISWTQFVILLFPILIALIVTLLKRRRPFKEYTLHLAIFFSLSILLTSWFLPHAIFGESHTNELFSDPLLAFRQEHENFPITSSIFDVEWIWHHLIRSLPTLYIFYLPLIGIAFVTPFFIGKRNTVVFVTILWISALFYLGMGSGFAGPLRFLLPAFLENPISLPLIQLLRSPVDFLIGYHVIFAILIAFGAQFLFERARSSQRKRVVGIFLIAIVFLSVAVPNSMWYTSLDSNFVDKGDSFPDLYKENPELIEFYHRLANEEGDYRLLMIPMLRYVNHLENEFQHARPWSDDPLSLWSPKQKIELLRVNPAIQEETNRFAKNLANYNLAEILYYMDLFNVKYVVLRNDVEAPEWGLTSGWTYSIDQKELQKRIFESNRDLFEPVFAGNLIDVYKIRHFNDQKISVLDTEAGRVNELDNSQSELKIRVEAPCENSTKFINTPHLQQVLIDKCSAGLTAIVKPFLIQKDSLYRFDISNFSTNSPFHVKLYFQDMTTENISHSLLNPFKVHESDAYYFYDSLSKPKTMSNEDLFGHFDTHFPDKPLQDSMYGYITLLVSSSENGNSVSFSDISLSELQIPGSAQAEPVITQSKINPTQWTATVNITEPSVLKFHESFAPGWKATLHNVDKDSYEVVGATLQPDGMNGFTINRTGITDILLKYEPQYWFEVGLVIAGLSLTVSIFFYVFNVSILRRNLRLR